MIAPKKSLGQHFLKNPKIVEKIVAAGEVAEGDTVLEIGPGTGALTDALLAAGAHVIAIEIDGRAVETLRETFSEEITTGQLQLIHEDIRSTTVAALDLPDRKYKLIANIPYYISGMLFEQFLSASTQPSLLVFLVQKEIAERIVRSKKESLLSLSVKVYGLPEYVATVSRGNFTPPPSVDSAILKISSISRDHFRDIDESFFFTVLHNGFKAKRKQLLGNLSDLADRETLRSLFSVLDIPLMARGEDLPVETWLSLTHALAVHRKQTEK